MRHTAALGKSEFAGRRGWGRRLWVLAAAMAAVLALAGALIVATERAGAQSTITFVSNLGRGADATLFVGSFNAGDPGSEIAGVFTTGANEAGYGLASVTLRLRADGVIGGSPTPDVVIHSDSSGTPGQMLYTFNNPSNISSMSSDYSDFTFTAPQPAPGLSPSTTYWIVVYATGDPMHAAATLDKGENTGNQDDWGIGDNLLFRDRGVGPWTSSDRHAVRMTLGGVVFSFRQDEEFAWDFPYSDKTWGFVVPGVSVTGRMTEPLDVPNRSNLYRKGDWWKLNVESGRRYRVEVDFDQPGHTQRGADRGGGIDLNYNSAWWDHNRDDGRAFIEFLALPDPYHLRVRAKDFLNDGSLEYYGTYQITLTDITGITKKVSNTDVYTEAIRLSVTNTTHKATSFTTGDHTGGYKLSYVGTGLHPDSGTSSVKAELWTDSGDAPGSKIFDFERIGAITGHPTAQYTDRFWVPNNIDGTLTASTTYWVVFKENNSGASYGLAAVSSIADNPGAASGWSIGDITLDYDTTDTSPSWVSVSGLQHQPALLEVFAANVVPSMMASEVVDQTAPQLQSATVDGASLTLAYDEELDSVAVSTGAFTVNVNGASRSVIVVAVVQSSVLLSLSAPVAAGDTVTVDYTAPTDEAAGRVQDTSGNAIESFSGQTVTNNTASSGGGGGGGRSVEQNPLGVPQSLEVALQQSGQLKAAWTAPGSGPTPTGYTVQWKAAVDAWDDPDVISESQVTKTAYVIGGLTDGVEYTARVVATRDGVDSAPSGEVNAIPQETTPPELSSASVDATTLTLTFNEPLDADEPPDTSAFAVTVAEGSRGVDTVTVSGSAATLTLVTAVVAGEAVTVDYTAPAGESESRLQDLVGNAAASFSGQSVTNNTPAGALLTVTTLEVPANHDGRGTFTFELHFSESPKRLFSYRTLRDHAFTLTGAR